MAKLEGMSSAWGIGIFDAHCHPTDVMSAIVRIPQMRARVLTIMASRSQDQDLVAETARKYPLIEKTSTVEDNIGQVVPSFGWHPWFAHQIFDDRGDTKEITASAHYKSVLNPSPEDPKFLSSLPQPLLLSDYLADMEQRLKEFPIALVGEVGLDRAFRVPNGEFKPGDTTHKTGGHEEGEYTPGSREGRSLTPYRVKMDHQKIILKAQLELAAKLQRSVSIHSVQTHGVVFDLLQELWKGHERPSKRSQRKNKDASGTFKDQTQRSTSPFPPRICMHSYSGPADALKQYMAASVPVDMYFSFSHLINFGSAASGKAVDVIQTISDDRILIESDFHCAGDQMDDLLEEIVLQVCTIKGWSLKQGVGQLKRNWERFVFGSEASE